MPLKIPTWTTRLFSYHIRSSPTMSSLRATLRLLVTFNIYGDDTEYADPNQLVSLMENLLKEYASATDIRSTIIKP